MKKGNGELTNILNECLERLLEKGENLEQCLTHYPKQAAELEPLLRTALQVNKASAVQPRPEFKARARYQFYSLLREAESKRGYPFFGRQSRWVTVMIVVLAIMLAGGGTVAAASNSMPDEPLYPVKLAAEQVRLTLALSKMGKAELYANLADRRVKEIVYIANKGEPEQVEQSTQRLADYLTMIAVLARAEGEGEKALAPPRQAREGGRGIYRAHGKAGLRTVVGYNVANHPGWLREALETAPESVKPALRRAIAISDEGYERALQALD